jgi:uncharacterized protein
MPDLIIDLAAIPESGYELETAVPSTVFSLESSDVQLSETVAVRARIQRAGTTVAVRGSIAATVSVPCGRCLERAEVPLEATIDVVAVPAAEMPDDEDHELSSSEMDLYYYSGEQLDLGAIVWDHLSVAIPVQPLCRPDCQGLCPSCGVNRNLASCDCSLEVVDERFAVLKKWQTRGHQK